MPGVLGIRTISTVIFCLVLASLSALAQAQIKFDLPAQPLSKSLNAVANIGRLNLLYDATEVEGRQAPALQADISADAALDRLLAGTNLEVARDARNPNAPRVITPKAVSKPRKARPPAPEPTSEAALVHLDYGQLNSVVDPVVITGTHIRDVSLTGVQTLTITRQDIEAAGWQTMEELAAALPQNYNGFNPAAGLGQTGNQMVAFNTNNATALDLRGLGPQSTLLLIDGHRVAGNVEGRVVDISMIPLSMVDHVDITTGGASAIYGADAVGGVANIVLRHSFAGQDTQLAYGGSAAGGKRVQFTQLAGREFARGGFVAGYEFARDEVFDVVHTNLVQSISEQGATLIAAPIVPYAQRHSLYSSGHLDVSDRVELFMDASYIYKVQHSFFAQAYPVYPLSIASNDHQRNTEINFTAGSRVRLGSTWQMQVSGSFSSMVNIQEDQRSNDFAGDVSDIQSGAHGRAALASAAAVADGTVISIAGIDIKGAAGLDFRRETLVNQYVPAPFLGIGAIANAQRSVASSFGELHIPLVRDAGVVGLRDLELSLAARDDHYSDFGNAVSPQASLAWQPVRGLTLRAAWSKAFRAPDLYTLNTGALVQLGPNTLATAANPTPIDIQSLTLAGGNPAVQPEHARTWSTGIDFKLPIAPAARLSLTYFEIDYRDRINNPFSSASVIDPEKYPASVVNLYPTPAQIAAAFALGQYAGNLTTQPWDGNIATLLQQIPGLVLIDERQQNISLEKLRGLDLWVDSRFVTPVGEATAGVNATRTVTHYQRITPESDRISISNAIGYPADFRARASAGLSHGAVSGFIFANYTGGYTNPYSAPVSRISAWTTLDLSVRWELAAGTAGTVAATLSALNVLDRHPPRFEQSTFGFLFDPSNANPFGRVLTLNVGMKW